MANQVVAGLANEFNRGIILPTIIKQLKSILQQYPDDGQILKELIQNGEDAGARKVLFLLDATSYPARQDKLHHPDLAQYQGPALYVYNDAVFTADDWKGIRMLNDSVKEKDPMKVGRFGLGFKSVFHMTDLPSIFSGNGIGFLDPHEQFFHVEENRRRYPTSSYLWDLENSREEIQLLEDQFRPFHQELFGLTNQTFSSGYFNGTVFRFPMRMEGMHSDLCDTKYDASKVRELFRSLETDAHIMLLFLKSLECIEVYEKTSQTASPTKLMSIKMAKNLNEEVRSKRLQFINQIEGHRNGNITDPVSIIYPLNVEFQNHLNNSPIETSKWIISQYYAGKSEINTAKDISDSLGLLPWVGVALNVQENSGTSSYLSKPKGHIFCFLPLPLEETSPTGLRVHVHGYFAVDSNRRHLKWPTADQNITQLTDKALIWNEFLVNKLLVKALVKLALHVVTPENRLRHDIIFDIIPDQMTPQWKYLAEEFYKQLPNLNIFYSSVSGGQWMNSRNAVFDNIEDKTELQALIRRILLENQTKIVSAPVFIKKHFANQITPTLVCQSLKNKQSVLSLQESEKFILLKYFLDNFPNGAELISMRLLPLADGTWTEFKQFTQAEKIYVESPEHPKTLFPGLERIFLRQDVSMFAQLKTLASRNVTQLVHLQPQYFINLLRSVLPSNWQNCNEVNISSAPILTVNWLHELWAYLTRHFTNTLNVFENLHILPVGNGQLEKLSRQSPLLLGNHSGFQLSGDVKTLLRKLGITVIDDLHPSVRNHPNLIGNYVLAPDATNVLLAMNRLFQTGMLSVSSLNDTEKKTLQKFLSSGLAGKGVVISNHTSLLHYLPIFQTINGSGFKGSECVSLSYVKISAQTDVNIPIELPHSFIDLTDNLVRDLAVHLGVVQYSAAQILEIYVFPSVNNGTYDAKKVITLMSFVCDNFARFQKSSSSFTPSVSNVRFVQKSGGELVTPRDVFDNSDQTLRSLFVGEDVFAFGEFGNSKYCQILRQLGMKGHEAVTASDLLRVAEKLNSSMIPDLSTAQTLLGFLENHSLLLDVSIQQFYGWKSLSKALQELQWVKPNLSRPTNYPRSVKFIGESYSTTLVLSTEVCSAEFGSIVGSVMSTVDTRNIPKVAAAFGWTKLPNIEIVVHHLMTVVSCYKPQEKSEFQFTIKAIYKCLNDAIKISTPGGTFEQLRSASWVWCGEGFVAPSTVVKTKPFMDLQPHMYLLPTDLKEFTHLWNFFGVPEKCSLVKVLKDIDFLHKNTACDKTQVKRDLQIAVDVLNEITSLPNKLELLDQLLVPIKTNDDKLHMKKINDVTYCDKEWFQKGFDVNDLVDDDISLVHPLLPLTTAEALKIHGLINRMLDAEELGFGFESYGQSEPLTRRLNNILKDYTDGLAVLKELVQNADDAGATEVKFLYDERRNDDAKTLLLDKGMTDLQGPALWAYNNAVFTPDDFQSLVKLSGATKEDSKDKIGKFGLGFNAVYNLTDVPSLVSQNHVVFLDPHTKYLGRAIRDKSRPGLKLDITNNRRRLKPLIDQFKPYNGIFDCDLSVDSAITSYPGTLFRFPLRTPYQASTSEICKKCYSHQEMMLLLELLSKSSHHLLLFTQHVRKITVFHLSDNSNAKQIMEEWFTIEKSLERAIRSLAVRPKKKKQKCVTEQDLERQCSFLKVVNQVLVETTDHASTSNIPKVESSLVIKVSCTHSNDSPKTFKSNHDSSISHWLIVSCLGRGASLEKARRNKDLIPVGGIAAKLRKTDKDFDPISLVSTSKDVQNEEHGLLFCFLPLPIRSSFPVHINGSFALTSSRMHIFENTVKDKIDERALWNEALVTDAITEAYLILMEDLLKVCTDCSPYALWPVHKSLKEAGSLSMLTETLYDRIFDANGPRIVRQYGQLFSMAECRYLEHKFRREPMGVTALKIFKEMKSLGFEVTDIPTDVYATIKLTPASSKLEERVVTKYAFYEQFFLPRVETAVAEGRDSLVMYALFDQSLIELLRNVACIPVKPRRKLKTCSELVSPLSYLAVLFDEEEDVFPDIKVTFDKKLEDIYRRLVELGMKEVSLSWEEISERCSVVTKIPQLVSKRLNSVVKLMSTKTISSDQCDTEFVEQIKKTRFLPTVKKPHGFPLKWKGEEIQFASCEESYLSNEKHLICSLYPVIDDFEAFRSESNSMHPLKNTLGLTGKPVGQQDLISQLERVLELADSSGSVSTVSIDGLQHVKKIFIELYKYLDKLAEKGDLSENTVDTLTSLRCIFVESGSTFMPPRSCALEIPVKSENLMPYLCQIPKTMMTYTHLLSTLKVRKNFQLEHYLEVLRNLNAAFPGVPLSESALQVALCIINSCLACEINKVGADSAEDIDPKQLFIPDEKGILCPVDSLCYNNCPWVVVDDARFCHDSIPYKAASTVGIKSIREDIIDKCSIGIEFGQKEKLVNRLKRILTGYPFDKEVLKEMLQNADDARATEIHFINDARQLPTERIFEDKWKPLQGPALCIFNNKPFTQSDIIGIQNLGEGSKSEDPTKTGQYGVGFNCVYHLTDAPSFLTQVTGEARVLCAFDPTLNFVPGANETSPGRMMKEVSKLKERFPDVFEGYFEEHYGLCGGTMFRLPLRNTEIAKKSTISNKEVTNGDVKRLFETFKTDMYESLLFLNSVEQIQLKEVDQKGKMTTIYKVHVELSEEARQKRKQFDEEVKKQSRALRNKEISLKNVGFSEVSYELVTKDNDGQIDKWQIIQRFGFEDSSQVSDKLNTAYSDGDIGLLPRSGIAYLKESTRHSTIRHKSRLFCFLPLPLSIDFPSHVNGHFALDHETRRNLWSDEQGGYKREWNRCMMKHVLAPAYCTLIQERRDILCSGAALNLSSYNSLFPNAKEGDGPYLTLLCRSVYEQIRLKNTAVLPVLRTTRDEKGREGMKYLWIGPNGMDEASWKMWINMDWNGPCGMMGISAYFDDLTNQINEPQNATPSNGRLLSHIMHSLIKPVQKKKSEVVRDVLVDSGFLLVSCPMNVFANFTSAGIKVERVSPDAVLSFFATYGQPNTLCRLKGLPKHLKETLFHDLETLKLLLTYFTGCDDYKTRLFGLPFLLTADGYLRCFDCNSIKYEPFFSEIVPHIQDQFLNHDAFKTLCLETDKDVNLCKIFTVQQFADALPGLLPPVSFKQDERPVTTNELKTSLNDNNLVWLSRVWRYLHSSLERQQTSTKAHSINQVTDTILPLMDWCLVPVSFKGQECLYPVKKSRCVISCASGAFAHSVDSALQKIGVPRPLLKYFSAGMTSVRLSESEEMYSKILGTIENAASVVTALEEVVKCGAITTKLSNSESTELLRYLSKSLETWKHTPNSMHTVKHLPMFTTVFGKQVALGESFVYVIPSRIPTTDMDSWTSSRGIIFLKNDREFETLYQFLGCTVLSETEVYCSYIFQHFELLTKNGQVIHLRFVRDKLLPNLKTENERGALLESLHSLAFIPTKQGSYECASQFYDNENDVFLSMHEPSAFPPEPYNSLEWNDFLKKCGMISRVSRTMFIQYAREIEDIARASVDETVRKKSRVLINHLFARDDVSDCDFLQKVKTIRFVPPHTPSTDKENLHVCYGKQNALNQHMLIPFKNSITAEHSDIVWTAQHVLPSWACPGHYHKERQFILTQLEIQDKAKPEVVAEHIKRLCTKWAPVPHKLKTYIEIVDEVLKRIYAFLKSNISAVHNVIGSTLKDTPCVFDIERCILVRPDQVVLRLHPMDEIAPYLITLPLEYGEFVSVFEAIGSTNDATIDQYVMVLEMIHNQAKDAILHPNEQEAVCKATKGFITLLGKEKGPMELGRELYLPGTDKRIHISSELVMDNSFALRERLEHATNFNQPLLINLKKECDINLSEYELECLINQLPADRQPQFLTAVVVETMVNDFVQEDSEFVKILESRLQSEELKDGLIRLAIHGVANENGKESETEIQKAVEGLQNLRLVGVNDIRTYLVYRGQRIEGSDRHRHFFIKEDVIDEIRCTTVYVCGKSTAGGSSHWFDIFYTNISKIVHRVTHNILRGAAKFYLLPILRCEEGYINNFLDQLNVRQDRRSASLEATFRPRPGQFVPIELHHLLKLDILLLKQGDFVALQTYDPADDEGGMTEQLSPTDPTYIMVKILKVLDEDGAAISVNYLIDDGHGGQTVNAALLFAFHRKVTDARDLSAILQVDDASETIELNLDDAKRDIRQTLLDAWKLPEETKKKYIKRLLLRWHPDKNPDQQVLATQATQYLFEAIDRLERGLSLDDENTSSPASTYRNGYSHSGYYGAYYSYISKRATEHRTHQEQYRKNYEQNTQNAEERRKRDFIRSFTVNRNPQPGEGRRWLRQAEWDLKAAGNDESGGNCPCGEWVCFKFYQAALKALKGAQYARDANNVTSIDFAGISKTFDNQDISGWAYGLQRIVGNPNYMQYPTDHQLNQIPHDVFTDDKVQRARELSQKIVDWCKNYIG